MFKKPVRPSAVNLALICSGTKEKPVRITTKAGNMFDLYLKQGGYHVKNVHAGFTTRFETVAEVKFNLSTYL